MIDIKILSIEEEKDRQQTHLTYNMIVISPDSPKGD